MPRCSRHSSCSSAQGAEERFPQTDFLKGETLPFSKELPVRDDCTKNGVNRRKKALA
ncbi:hypothetical protein SCFA_520010 [anaerobic digester metagenome]|uniref:Uncharacterized protein n=1 Tax=anaerobic digester metagenome TaxID=1263854 RepID=A0A485M4L6_9ZZZZ